MPRGGAGHFGAAEPFCTSNTILTCFLLLCEGSAHHRSHSEAPYCFATVAAHALTVLPTHGCPCSMGHEAVPEGSRRIRPAPTRSASERRPRARGRLSLAEQLVARTLRRHEQYNQQSAFKRSSEMHCSRLQLQVRATRRSGQAAHGHGPDHFCAFEPALCHSCRQCCKKQNAKSSNVLLMLEPSVHNCPQIERVNENSALQVSAS